MNTFDQVKDGVWYRTNLQIRDKVSNQVWYTCAKLWNEMGHQIQNQISGRVKEKINRRFDIGVDK